MTAAALLAHLKSGATTVCRAWSVTRKDGLVLGFTDHDRDLIFGGITCRANTGMTARALQQTTGLSVDNSEAIGALSDASVTEADLLAGRYDGAEVRAWLVNWANPEERVEQFRGALGEILRSGGSFKAELRGLSDALNQPQGFAYQTACSAVLGDARCGFVTSQPGYFADRVVEGVVESRMFTFQNFTGFDDRWFEYGRCEVLTGAAAGLVGVVKSDRFDATARRIELWQSMGDEVVPGDMIRLIAGCDKVAATCRTKFANFLNFRGFPHIPGDDWLGSYPVSGQPTTGGSLFGTSIFAVPGLDI
jgi:uncharacterized phage protein (TIGR02218 family)